MTQTMTGTDLDLEGRASQREVEIPSRSSVEGLDRRRASAQEVNGASRMGWILRTLSIGLGLWQLVSPRRFARSIGVSNGRRNLILIRTLGARELGMGLGGLNGTTPARWLWARVAGDVFHLGLLGNALRSRKSDRARVAGALAAVASVTLLDAWRVHSHAAAHGDARRVPIRRSTTIARPPAEVYRFWRDFQNLPKFMVHLESVETLDSTSSYWRARSVGGKTFEWNAAIVEDRENELIRWRTVGSSQVAHEGEVRFVAAPGGRGTEIHIEATYDPPGGTFGRTVAQAFGQEPSQQIEGDLRRLKQVLEVGEVIESDASLHRGKHAARPSVAPRVRRHGGQS